MDRNQAFKFFDLLIEKAKTELTHFTKSTVVRTEIKADRTLVSNCDLTIDKALSKLVSEYGFAVISEEGTTSLNVVGDGNYVTIDPIDGTLGYLTYVQDALDRGSMEHFGKQDLGPEYDFSLLIGIVENGHPRFGACSNYITGETILIDGLAPEQLVWRNRRRIYNGSLVAFVDPRPGDFIEDKIREVPNVNVITQATLGLKSLYAIIGPHSSSVVCHRVQEAGLWDIAPAAVATRAFGGGVFDDYGQPVTFNKYVVLPGRGATVIKGQDFEFVLNQLAHLRKESV